MSFTGILFYILAIVLIIAAGRVITARSPVTAVLHLILSFFTASMLWILIGAEFLGLILLIVYVGAVMVLFLFVVMMIDVVPESLRKGFRSHLPVALVVGGIMVVEIAAIFGSAYLDSGSSIMIPDGYNNTLELGKAMYTTYSYPIQVGAILLLVGMISAVAVSFRGRRPTSKDVDVERQLRVRASDRLRMVKLESGTEKVEPTTEEQPVEGENK